MDDLSGIDRVIASNMTAMGLHDAPDFVQSLLHDTVVSRDGFFRPRSQLRRELLKNCKALVYIHLGNFAQMIHRIVSSLSREMSDRIQKKCLCPSGADPY